MSLNSRDISEAEGIVGDCWPYVDRPFLAVSTERGDRRGRGIRCKEHKRRNEEVVREAFSPASAHTGSDGESSQP